MPLFRCCGSITRSYLPRFDSNLIVVFSGSDMVIVLAGPSATMRSGTRTIGRVVDVEALVADVREATVCP